MSTVDPVLVGDVFLQQLEEKRLSDAPTAINRKRKKVQVTPGTSITPDDFTDNYGNLANNSHDSVTVDEPEPRPQKSKNKNRRVISSESSSSDEESISLASSTDTHPSSDSDNKSEGSPVSGRTMQSQHGTAVADEIVSYSVDDFVIVLFNGTKYIGQIVEMEDSGASVKCMEKMNKLWRWPAREDVASYEWGGILKKVDPPVKVNKRNQYTVKELEEYV